MNGHGWRTIFAIIFAAGVGAAWVANAQLASLETGLDALTKQVDYFTTSFDERLRDLETQRRPTAFGGPQ